jgi:hypothetical protein
MKPLTDDQLEALMVSAALVHKALFLWGFTDKAKQPMLVMALEQFDTVFDAIEASRSKTDA